MSRRNLLVNGRGINFVAKQVRQRRLFRMLRVEALERRCVMAADFSTSAEFDANQILIELDDSTFASQVLPAGSEQMGGSAWWTFPPPPEFNSVER